MRNFHYENTVQQKSTPAKTAFALKQQLGFSKGNDIHDDVCTELEFC